MTKEDAREILLNSKDLQTEEQNGVTYYCKLGEFCGEYDMAISFVVYCYSSKSPFDPTYAFEYWVNKETGDIGCASAPIQEKRLKEIQQRGERG